MGTLCGLFRAGQGHGVGQGQWPMASGMSVLGQHLCTEMELLGVGGGQLLFRVPGELKVAERMSDNHDNHDVHHMAFQHLRPGHFFGVEGLAGEELYSRTVQVHVPCVARASEGCARPEDGAIEQRVRGKLPRDPRDCKEEC